MEPKHLRRWFTRYANQFAVLFIFWGNVRLIETKWLEVFWNCKIHGFKKWLISVYFPAGWWRTKDPYQQLRVLWWRLQILSLDHYSSFCLVSADPLLEGRQRSIWCCKEVPWNWCLVFLRVDYYLWFYRVFRNPLTYVCYKLILLILVTESFLLD